MGTTNPVTADGRQPPNRRAIEDLLGYLTADELAQIDELIGKPHQLFWPLPGPQAMAYASQADIVGFGGAAGGGKTMLAVGKALTQHRKVMILRREATQLTGIIDEITGVLGGRDGYNGQERIWRLPGGRQIECGSVPNLGDETRYQGRPHVLLVFDETANFLEAQVRFLMGWARTSTPGQRVQVLMTFNPPTSAEGRWLLGFFAPWIDRKHPCPAAPGELRWFAAMDGKEVEVDGPDPIANNGEVITPKSRTFIPSRITDNPYLMETGYMAQLQMLPEPLRSQMLYGDFNAGLDDDPWQVIPTAWVEDVMTRWQRPNILPRMDSLGVDVARGGKDRTTIARRHGNWFDVPLVYPGSATPDGPAVRATVIGALRDNAPIHIDVIGVGASPFDFLREARQQVLGVNVAERSMGLDKSGRLSFANVRSELWWRMREWLDPANNTGAQLPDSAELLAELTAPRWELKGPVIQVESRDEIVKRVGRSPDVASAYILGLIDTPRMADIDRAQTRRNRDYDPYQ